MNGDEDVPRIMGVISQSNFDDVEQTPLNKLTNESEVVVDDVDEEKYNQLDLDTLVQQIEDVKSKLKKYDEKLKDRSVGFNGYKDLRSSDELFRREPENSLKKSIYDSVVKGDLSLLEYLFNQYHVDINLTLYSENLLMCAIRNGQEKIAEYLINRGIDVNFQTDLFEFDEDHVPVRFYKYSCREMAYDYGLFKIVDLIDIFSKGTDKKIVKHLAKRYIKCNDESENNSSGNSQKLEKSSSVAEYEDRIESLLLSREAQILYSTHQYDEEKNSSRQDDENRIYSELNIIKPPSEHPSLDLNNDEFHPQRADSADSDSIYIPTNSVPKNTNVLRPIQPLIANKIDRDLNRHLVEQLKLNDQPPEKHNPNRRMTEKVLFYDGYKINLHISRDTNRSIASNTSRLSSRMDLNSENQFEISKLIMDRSDSSEQLSRATFKKPSLKNKNKTNSPLPKKSVSKITYNMDQKLYSHEDKKLNKNQVRKINSHLYLNSLSSQHSSMQKLIEQLNGKDNQQRKREPNVICPFEEVSSDELRVKQKQSASIQVGKAKKTTKVKFKLCNVDENDNEPEYEMSTLERNSSQGSDKLLKSRVTTVEKNANIRLEKNSNPLKTKLDVKNSYLGSLRRAGLVNKYSSPIMNHQYVQKTRVFDNSLKIKMSSFN